MTQIDYNEFPEHLRFPAFKLWERAQYERECASADGGFVSGDSANGITHRASDEESAASRARCLQRAEGCEAALELLRSAA